MKKNGDAGSFWIGFTAAVCWNGVIQDWMGKDRWLEATRLLWVDTKWWYWPFLLLGMVVLVGVSRALEKTEEAQQIWTTDPRVMEMKKK